MTPNLQMMSVLQPANNIDPTPGVGDGNVTIVDNTALISEEGPAGTLADIVKPANPTISVYVVQPGDTLSSIAKLFGVTTGTILSANDLPRSAVLQPGDQLVILPIAGVQYTVKKGDTIESIAKAFDGDVTEIESYNNIDDSSLAVGTQIIIPNGEASASPALATTKGATASTKPGKSAASTKVLHGTAGDCGTFIPDADNPAEPSHNVGPIGSCQQDAYYISPLAHFVQTQGIHGYNAVDLAASIGSPIMASADGTVIVARSGGWNGGYGSYVVIQHPNGAQTLYGHMSKVAAYDGEPVVQGQVIGYVGETGDATGPHLHFEIRDGIRNPF
ncbi:MAG: LysM peptidoglycan-binding domain-containing protein [Candidatus Pacebacteria bacterium]|nr:LysM peptidoglycan-binding domain-containing protein [Candidatus Paceibacterota bacterium]